MKLNTVQKRKRLDCCVIFSVGAVVYTLSEILWRGHSHWTMTVTGGLCTLFIHLANRRLRQRGLLVRCLAGSGIITGMEFTVGCIVNRLLGWQVWDYSGQPLNIMGQVCLLYSVMWFFMSIPAILLSNLLDSTRRIREQLAFD